MALKIEFHCVSNSKVIELDLMTCKTYPEMIFTNVLSCLLRVIPLGCLQNSTRIPFCRTCFGKFVNNNNKCFNQDYPYPILMNCFEKFAKNNNKGSIFTCVGDNSGISQRYHCQTDFVGRKSMKTHT